MASQIVSVSRRTDVPAFYASWFKNRLVEGYAIYRNPFDASRSFSVSLRPEDVSAFVFWSKNFAPFVPVLRELRVSYGALFQYTITGYGRDLETAVPDLDVRLHALQEMGRIYPTDAVFWRYDTVIITDRYTLDWHRENFRRLCGAVSGQVDRCIISFLQVYGSVGRNLRGVSYVRLEAAAESDFADELAAIAADHGLSVFCCCQDHLRGPRVGASSCIDSQALLRLYPERFPRPVASRGTRRMCRCAASRDIGAYNTCGHGCRYCYAVRDHGRALAATRLEHGSELGERRRSEAGV
jgi:hypothetical protein